MLLVAWLDDVSVVVVEGAGGTAALGVEGTAVLGVAGTAVVDILNVSEALGG